MTIESPIISFPSFETLIGFFVFSVKTFLLICPHSNYINNDYNKKNKTSR
jgi:hypothetical protein